MLLNTGPTGSGKTTTLYTFLRELHTPEIKIITIEDPVEYHLEGIVQTQVEGAKYTFAEGLRSIVRQDPDIIMVGEIRDGETANIAIQAALTGHFVFSTASHQRRRRHLPAPRRPWCGPKVLWFGGHCVNGTATYAQLLILTERKSDPLRTKRKE